MSDPDCVRVNPAPCDVAEMPGAIRLLYAVKSGDDAQMEWEEDLKSARGYRVYRTTREIDIASSKTVGLMVAATNSGSRNRSATYFGAVPISTGPLHYYQDYQVVGVCRDGKGEGPL